MLPHIYRGVYSWVVYVCFVGNTCLNNTQVGEYICIFMDPSGSFCWFKDDGIVVLHDMILGMEVSGRPLDYVYESITLNFRKNRVTFSTGEIVYVDNLEVSNSIMLEFLRQRSDVIHFFGNTQSATKAMVLCYRLLEVEPVVTRIQRAWRRCVSDPAYKVCRDRLMREYNELF